MNFVSALFPLQTSGPKALWLLYPGWALRCSGNDVRSKSQVNFYTSFRNKLKQHTGLNTLPARVIKLFWQATRKLVWKSRDLQEFLEPSKCKNSTFKTLIFGLLVAFYTKFFFFSNLVTLLWTFVDPQKGRDP